MTQYEQSFSRIRNDINGLISVLSCALDPDVETISEYIRRNFVNYERLTNEYADFPVKSQTFESEQLGHSHMMAFESLRTTVTSALAPKPDPRVSQDAPSQSGSHRSSTSSTRF